jgi:hypothetical protein
MRRTLVLAVMALVSVTVFACGASKTTHSATRDSHGSTTAIATQPGGYSTKDGDEDYDDTGHYHGSPANDDQALLASYGPRASPAVTRAVTSLVEHYYAASAAGDGAQACSMLTANLADGLAAGEGQPGGGKSHTCAAAMSLLLAQQRQNLRGEDVSTMAVTTVRVKGDLGLAVLAFKTTPESEIVLEREGHTWKVDALFGGYMP